MTILAKKRLFRLGKDTRIETSEDLQPLHATQRQSCSLLPVDHQGQALDRFEFP
jgi:hypothetical protein